MTNNLTITRKTVSPPPKKNPPKLVLQPHTMQRQPISDFEPDTISKKENIIFKVNFPPCIPKEIAETLSEAIMKDENTLFDVKPSTLAKENRYNSLPLFCPITTCLIQTPITLVDADKTQSDTICASAIPDNYLAPNGEELDDTSRMTRLTGLSVHSLTYLIVNELGLSTQPQNRAKIHYAYIDTEKAKKMTSYLALISNYYLNTKVKQGDSINYNPGKAWSKTQEKQIKKLLSVLFPQWLCPISKTLPTVAVKICYKNAESNNASTNNNVHFNYKNLDTYINTYGVDPFNNQPMKKNILIHRELNRTIQKAVNQIACYYHVTYQDHQTKKKIDIPINNFGEMERLISTLSSTHQNHTRPTNKQ